jgi:hypothetical protein
MRKKSKESDIILAIEAIHTNHELSIRRAAEIYGVSLATLSRRIRGRTPRSEIRNSMLKLTSAEEETLVRHIINLDSRGFPPRFDYVRDMANLLLATRHAPPVGKQWPYNFVQRRTELKTRFSRAYDFQRALCEDPDIINAWFRLVANMRAKYGIQDCDFYNFDETGFQMGVICGNMVITCADRRGKGKQLQPGNREWATAIECVSSDGFALPPFLILQGVNHLASWYQDLPSSWVIKPSSNGWTDNETGLEWIRHFDMHTKVRQQGAYRMLILDGHESHVSAEFEDYCKKNCIITLCLPAHSSHLTQPLDVGCFSTLKRVYGRKLEDLIRAHITHITKLEFLVAFKSAHFKAITLENIKGGFRGSGLVPYNPQAVLSRLDVKLRTPTPTSPPLPEADPWVSQTPHTSTDAISQSEHVRNRLARHQGSSPTPLFSAVAQLAKGTELIAHEMTLLHERVRSLEKANQALARRRRAKRTRIQAGGALTTEDAQRLIARKEDNKKGSGKRLAEEGVLESGPSTSRRCKRCGKAGHNIRTCQEVEEATNEEDCINCS